MRRVGSCVALAGVLGVTACAVPGPAGPSFAAMPGNGKTFEQFQGDDARCRQAAFQGNGGVTPGQAANESGVGSAVVGTALGAGAGALIGSAAGAVGAGAAIGAGAGLLAGSAVGAGNARASAYGLQRNFDITYAQCMAASGEKVPDLASAQPGYGVAYPPPYPAYAYDYGYSPYYYGPPVAVGFGWGWGGGWHRWRRW